MFSNSGSTGENREPSCIGSNLSDDIILYSLFCKNINILVTLYLPMPLVSHPSPGDNHQSTGGWSERTQGQANMAA